MISATSHFDEYTTLSGHTGSVETIQPLNKTYLVSGGSDQTIKLWNLNTSECLDSLEGHSGLIRCIEILPNGNIISGSYDRTIKLWNIKNGECLETFVGHKSWILCLGVFSNDDIFASGSDDGIIKLWNSVTNECLDSFQAHNGWVLTLEILRNNDLASGGSDNLIKIWDIDSGNCLKTLEGHTDSIRCVKELSNGNLISGSYDKTIKIWDLKTSNCIKTLRDHDDWVLSLNIFSSNFFASGSSDNTIKIWNLKNYECIQTIKNHNESVTSLEILPNGILISGSNDKTIKLFGSIFDNIEYSFKQYKEGNKISIDLLEKVFNSWLKGEKKIESLDKRILKLLQISKLERVKKKIQNFQKSKEFKSKITDKVCLSILEKEYKSSHLSKSLSNFIIIQFKKKFNFEKIYESEEILQEIFKELIQEWRNNQSFEFEKEFGNLLLKDKIVNNDDLLNWIKSEKCEVSLDEISPEIHCLTQIVEFNKAGNPFQIFLKLKYCEEKIHKIEKKAHENEKKINQILKYIENEEHN